MKLYHYDFTGNKTFEKVRDIFCFGCFTGQRFSDIANLQRSDIKGSVWQLRTAKTKDSLEIPLNRYAIEILGKYKDQDMILPVISNQKTNFYIKQICKALGFNDIIKQTMYRGAERVVFTEPKYEYISMHTARRTFVTLALQKGMLQEVIMEITGHKDYKTFRKYVKITSKEKYTQMKAIWG